MPKIAGSFPSSSIIPMSSCGSSSSSTEHLCLFRGTTMVVNGTFQQFCTQPHLPVDINVAFHYMIVCSLCVESAPFDSHKLSHNTDTSKAWCCSCCGCCSCCYIKKRWHCVSTPSVEVRLGMLQWVTPQSYMRISGKPQNIIWLVTISACAPNG
jgi:hypothetical protein